MPARQVENNFLNNIIEISNPATAFYNNNINI